MNVAREQGLSGQTSWRLLERPPTYPKSNPTKNGVTHFVRCEKNYLASANPLLLSLGESLQLLTEEL